MDALTAVFWLCVIWFVGFIMGAIFERDNTKTRAVFPKPKGYEPEDGILLPGFTCISCGAFTGVLREDLKECQCCGKKQT